MRDEKVGPSGTDSDIDPIVETADTFVSAVDDYTGDSIDVTDREFQLLIRTQDRQLALIIVVLLVAIGAVFGGWYVNRLSIESIERRIPGLCACG